MICEIVSLAVAGAGFMADRKSKDYIEEHYRLREPVEVRRGINIERMENRGFAGSRLENRSRFVLAFSTVISLLLIIAYALVLGKSASKLLKIGMGLLVGGAAGNMYDRWKKHYVTDFINLSVFKKIIFNVADICIVVGSIMILVADAVGGKA